MYDHIDWVNHNMDGFCYINVTHAYRTESNQRCKFWKKKIGIFFCLVSWWILHINRRFDRIELSQNTLTDCFIVQTNF